MADTLDGARSQIRDAGLIVLTRAQMTASVAVWDSKQTHRPPRGVLLPPPCATGVKSKGCCRSKKLLSPMWLRTSSSGYRSP